MNVGNPFDDPQGSDPPLFVVHGKLDSIVPFENASEIQGLAIEAGLPFEFHALEGRAHVMDPLFDEASPGVTIQERSVEWLAEILAEPAA